MSIDVLMLGWEFPPFISGGLGTACYGLTHAMKDMDVNILMLLPASTWGIEGQTHSFFEMESSLEDSPEHITFKPVPSEIPNPYYNARSHPFRIGCAGAIGGYDGNLVERVSEYARCCTELMKDQSFDVIHAHDWVTYPAGIALSSKYSKPLIVHVHATEFDRSGSFINQKIFEIERKGMAAASVIIAVSEYTADIIMSNYGVPRHKIRVVHNGISHKNYAGKYQIYKNGDKIVLFLGRITGQKGPYHFVEAAEKVLQKLENVKFIMVGWGDLAPSTIETVAAKNLGTKILFTGFLRGWQVERAYRSADVYVMPSVSEPFGLTAVEAIQQNIPVILSKTSGVGEILNKGVVKIDFWDSNKIAETIIKILSNPQWAEELVRNGKEEIRNLTWEAAAKKCVTFYHNVMANMLAS
ncbi:MAG: glycosyltransferase family 4 protein [Sedimentisphaerales bacterium]|nr:glycosyltransferase family 4 protein [Sedimentisphaerales bacterium]